MVNSGNGSNSQNSGNVDSVNNSTTNQNNTASVRNNLDLATTSGDNSASKNVGGDNLIITGDANTSGTVITVVNTNIDGVAVSEFNIADDHLGDIVLDFISGCTTGCANFGNAEAVNSGNGENSQNNAVVSNLTDSATFQNNDANVENDLYLASNSGDNNAMKNTSGDSEILTGDANVSANVVTLANNNIAGNVIYSVVNIFGDLVGDIIMPADYFQSMVTGNTGNGANSSNSSVVNESTENLVDQSNNANVENILNLAATTGNNQVDRNTNGNSSITTGDASVTAQVLNVINSNLVGGDWWIVLVNEAGNWIGKILGSPDGSNFAGSSGFEFAVNENGEINATNSGNGADSTNNSTVSESGSSSVNQTNTANVVNNIDLFANTGGNNASRNTGGNSSVTTGDANIIANLTNFINNNITGGGRLFVTVVNVFGSWVGDFVSPGTHKENTPAIAENSQTGGGEVGGYMADLRNSDSSLGADSLDHGEVGLETIGSQNTYIASNIPGYEYHQNVAGQVLVASESSAGQSLIAGERASSKLNINLAWIIPFVLMFGLYIGIKRTISLKFSKT